MMSGRWLDGVRRWWRLGLVLALLAGYWLLPISGQVVILPGERAGTLAWPRLQVAAGSLEPGRALTIEVTDIMPWAHTGLTINGQPAGRDHWWASPGGTWTWQWTVTPSPAMLAAAGDGHVIVFYRDCDTGCRQRGQFTLAARPAGQAVSRPPESAGQPTKLGLVFANPDRDWYGRRGWTVELSYVRLADSSAVEDERWTVDQLAARVAAASARGLRVLVRVDLDRGQSLPPEGNHLALGEYLRHLQRLARDARLGDVYAYIIGTSPNAIESNQAGSIGPAWYARLFNGAGEAAQRADNAVQVIRSEHPRVRVLVGPLRPGVDENGGGQGGNPTGSPVAALPALPPTPAPPPSASTSRPVSSVTVSAPIAAAPWLSYATRLVEAIDAGARAKAAAGIEVGLPDGFAAQAPGRPELARARTGGSGADEPLLSLVDLATGDVAGGGAQLGFRAYADLLAVINAVPSTRGRPVYITATNTFAAADNIPPAQNYPPGWLTSALQAVNDEPQVAALCWFLDGPLGDRQWDWFSLSRPTGRLIDAADEFDRLLRSPGVSR